MIARSQVYDCTDSSSRPDQFVLVHRSRMAPDRVPASDGFLATGASKRRRQDASSTMSTTEATGPGSSRGPVTFWRSAGLLMPQRMARVHAVLSWIDHHLDGRPSASSLRRTRRRACGREVRVPPTHARSVLGARGHRADTRSSVISQSVKDRAPNPSGLSPRRRPAPFGIGASGGRPPPRGRYPAWDLQAQPAIVAAGMKCLLRSGG